MNAPLDAALQPAILAETLAGALIVTARWFRHVPGASRTFWFATRKVGWSLVPPLAVAALVAPVVDGPRRGGVVVASFPTCVYAVLDDPDLPAAARLVAVLAPGALLLPGGIRLATGRVAGGWASGSVGDRVVVGSGVVELPGWSARMVRVWQPTRVRRRAVMQVVPRHSAVGCRCRRWIRHVEAPARATADDRNVGQIPFERGSGQL